MVDGQGKKRSRRRLSGQEYITVGSMAEYCMVSPATIRRWIAEEKLSATRLPSGHYRVSVEDFKSFLKRYNMPISKELQPDDV